MASLLGAWLPKKREPPELEAPETKRAEAVNPDEHGEESGDDESEEETKADKNVGQMSEPSNKRKKCEHGRILGHCAKCGTRKKEPPRKCVHGRQKSLCKRCGGVGICCHGRQQRMCVLCGTGNGLCIHKKVKRMCKICNAASLCPHGKLRQCKVCHSHSRSFCEHKRLKNGCRDCFASGIPTARICIHGGRKSRCKLGCGGGELCCHEIIRNTCNKCVSIEILANKKNFCVVCGRKYDHRRARSKPTCAECDAATPIRSELIVRELILKHVKFLPSLIDDSVGGVWCETRKRRPDLAWISTDRVIICEFDENGGHSTRDTSCELARVCDLTTTFKKILGEHIYIVVVRMNPDEYDGGYVTLKERAEVVGSKINELITTEMKESGFIVHGANIGYYYYHSKAQFQVDAALAVPDAFHVFQS